MSQMYSTVRQGPAPRAKVTAVDTRTAAQLGAKLREVYGDVVEEAIPADMMSLIGKICSADQHV